MKISELWLQEWVKPTLSREQLGARMTMAGLEIESITPVAELFSKVVIGHVLKIEKHPEADRLNVCEVDVGGAQPLTIVCGAQNVKVGMKTPAALEGAELPNNFKIKVSKLRGVTSHGMLCSAKELSLAEESEGLMTLSDDAPIGRDFWEYFQLSDYVIDVSITPNRGDCLSIIGIAKEVSALTQTPLTELKINPVKPTIQDVLTVNMHEPAACSQYVGRIIRNVKADANTPVWLQERLRRAGVRCISPVVDVMNYVMLELGQPMHAFDLSKITGNIQVRMAKENETVELLDGQTVKLTSGTLLIADDKNPLAIAGVMGGLDSAVTLLTKDIFLESAYFHPEVIAKSCRYFNLGSESSYRFERGIDPALQERAIERATELLLAIVGGEAGPTINKSDKASLPTTKTIHLRVARVAKILGMEIPKNEIEDILSRLGFVCNAVADGWNVIVPTRRPDVSIEVDLIEEVMRLYGSDRVPLRHSVATMQMMPQHEEALTLQQIRHALRDLGYHEIVSYSFVDQKLQAMLDPGKIAKPLVNPITSDMNVMRTNLWPGLVKTLMYNLNRQQNRVRLFESGLRFVPHGDNYLQERVLAGLISGSAFPEQWGVATRKVDYFDLKGDLEAFLRHTLRLNHFTFVPAKHAGLHPGQSAEVHCDGKLVGHIGCLHPLITQELDLSSQVFVFELLLEQIEQARLPRYSEVSKFPEIRRDIAIFVDRSIPVQAIQDTIIETGGELLKEVNLFDVYQGQNVSESRKSLALSLTLQDGSRTLVDEEVTDLMERVIVVLKERFAAELRG